jgi:hypothetical protein
LFETKGRWKLSAIAEQGTVPLPRPVKEKVKQALVAVSLANLLFLRPSFDLLFDQNAFFERLPVTSVELVALIMNILGAGLFFWLLMRLQCRLGNRVLDFILHLAFLLLLLIPVDFVRTKIFQVPDFVVLQFLKQPVVILCMLAAAFLAAWQHRRAAIIAANLVGILSSLALVMVVKILLLCFGITHLQQCADKPGTLMPLVSVKPGQPRVVWMIFDELDYRVVFDQRPDWSQLPAFDRVVKETLHASDAHSPADATLFSMPRLILGRTLSNDFVSNHDLMVTAEDTGKTTTFRALPNVFSTAHELGLNTAAVGWYIPYDRLLSGELNYCMWYPWPPFEPSRSDTFLGSLHNQIACIAWSFHARQIYADACREDMKAALNVATNANYSLALLHMPPPHRPGVYNAAKHKISIWDTIFKMSGSQGYFNNLALADDELGRLQRAMQANGLWDKTWVILSADHSWRTSTMYDGKRDMRVPFMVKPPGPTASAVYPQSFNTIVTHDLILAMLRGEMTNQQNVVDWLDKHRAEHDYIPGTSTKE